MAEELDTDEKRRNAIRNILFGWGDLSRGDISIICAVLRERGGTVLTCAGSAHANFWQNLLALDYAEKLYSPIDPVDEAIETLAFRLTEKGLFNLPMFLIHYDLLNCGACSPVSESIEVPLRQRRSPATLRLLHTGAVALFVAFALYLSWRGEISTIRVFLVHLLRRRGVAAAHPRHE